MHNNTISIILLLLVIPARTLETNNLRPRRNKNSVGSGSNTNEPEYERNLAGIEVKPITPGGISGENVCENILGGKKVVRNTGLQAYNTVKIGEVTISERFTGLKHTAPKGTIGLEDNLYGTPTSPLTLQENVDDRQNVYIQKMCSTNVFADDKICTLSVMGRGPAGFIGFGSLALLFDTDQSNLRLKFWSDGTAAMVVMIYSRSGRELGVLDIDLGITDEYSFIHRPGKIAGIAVWPKGEQLEWHKYSLIGLCMN